MPELFVFWLTHSCCFNDDLRQSLANEGTAKFRVYHELEAWLLLIVSKSVMDGNVSYIQYMHRWLLRLRRLSIGLVVVRGTCTLILCVVTLSASTPVVSAVLCCCSLPLNSLPTALNYKMLPVLSPKRGTSVVFFITGMIL